ncbi:MAG: hypothetical protein JTT11_09015 [Candidatus Brockarchaeota archaeon]|nr:hypothetical protein [Candidatus Brockarchaeota archaeon]
MHQGLYPLQTIFIRRRFKHVLLNPPNFNPGSWCGAGRLWIDREDEEYWLTSRPREGGIKRGYAVEIYRSKNGEDYSLVTSITKEELSEKSGIKVHSIENQQLLRDPLTGLYFLYLSVDIAKENIAGDAKRIFESKWETYLLSSEDPSGPWKPEGFVLRGDKDYDSGEARDSTIDIIEGQYFCLYKARRAGTNVVNTASAISQDGKNWSKLGILKVDGKTQPNYFLLSGSILPSPLGPIFMGTKTNTVVKGASLTRDVVAFRLDFRNMNLETVFSTTWIPGSSFEHREYPIHTYAQVVPDIIRKNRWLIWIEAVDPNFSKELGLNLEVDRVLLYTTQLIQQ